MRVVPSVVSNEPATGAPGRLIAVYKPRKPNQLFQWSWWVGGAVTSLGFLGYGTYQALAYQARFGVIPAVTRSAGWFVAGCFLVFAWLSGILYGHYRRQPVVRLHAHGSSERTSGCPLST